MCSYPPDGVAATAQKQDDSGESGESLSSGYTVPLEEDAEQEQLQANSGDCDEAGDALEGSNWVNAVVTISAFLKLFTTATMVIVSSKSK